jgi:hypothetical protein
VNALSLRARLNELLSPGWDEDKQVDERWMTRAVLLTDEDFAAEPSGGQSILQWIPPFWEEDRADLTPGTLAWPVLYKDGKLGVIVIWPNEYGAQWRAGRWRHGHWEHAAELLQNMTTDDGDEGGGFIGDREEPDEAAWIFATNPAPAWPDWRAEQGIA